MKNLKIFKTKTMLILFFILMLAPISVYADESADEESMYEGSKGYTEKEDMTKSSSNESETITDETAVFEGNYDSEEAANNKKEEKEQEYSDAGYENIESEITEFTVEEETGKQIEEYVGSTTETEEEAYVFDNEEDANAKKEELEVDDHDKKVTVLITKRTVDSGEDEVITIEMTFDSEDEAKAYIASLEEEGYVVESSITPNETLEVNNAITHIFGTPIVQTPARNRYLIIRRGANTYIWTERALSNDERAEFKNSYKEVANDPIITGNSINSANFINGYGVFGPFLSPFTITLILGVIDITPEAGSRIVFGTFGNTTEYILTGTATKDIMKDEWALDVTTETKLYEYHPETVDSTWYHLVVKADIPAKKEKKEKKSSKKHNNPQTEDEILTYIVTLTVSLGSLIGALAYTRRREN